MLNGSTLNGSALNGGAPDYGGTATLDVTLRRAEVEASGYHSQSTGVRDGALRRASLEAYSGASLSQRLRRSSIEATGGGPFIGRLDATLRRAGFDGHAYGDALGRAEQVLRRATLDANAGANLTAGLRRAVMEASGYGDFMVRMDVTLRRATLDATGYADAVGRLDATLRRATSLWGVLGVETRRASLEAAGVTPVTAEAIAYAMNLASGGLMPYSNYAFDFIVQFQGKSYGLNSSGCFLLEGDDDNGSPIPAYVELPPTDFGMSNQKRVEGVYLGSRSPGSLLVTAEVDESRSVAISTTGAGRNKRAKIPKGLKGVLWSVRVDNVDGGDLDVDVIEVLPAITRRKI